jgi:hypothetical protein
VQFKV